MLKALLLPICCEALRPIRTGNRSASWTLRLARYLAIFLARVFVILYDEATEEDLRALSAYEVRRILSEVDGQLINNPTTPTRRKKLLAGRRKGSKTTKEIL